MQVCNIDCQIIDTVASNWCLVQANSLIWLHALTRPISLIDICVGTCLSLHSNCIFLLLMLSCHLLLLYLLLFLLVLLCITISCWNSLRAIVLLNSDIFLILLWNWYLAQWHTTLFGRRYLDPLMTMRRKRGRTYWRPISVVLMLKLAQVDWYWRLSRILCGSWRAPIINTIFLTSTSLTALILIEKQLPVLMSYWWASRPWRPSSVSCSILTSSLSNCIWICGTTGTLLLVWLLLVQILTILPMHLFLYIVIFITSETSFI